MTEKTGSAPGPKLRMKLLALVAGIAAGLLCAEIAARIYILVRPLPGLTHIVERGVSIDLFTENPRGTYVDARADRTFGGPLRPQVDEALAKGHRYGLLYRRNQKGYRDIDFPLHSENRRVAFIGDSFTFGQGVVDGGVYPRVFEDLLRQSGDAKTEVLNLGYPGYDIGEIVYAFQTAAVPLGADEIYYGFVMNDPIGAPEFAHDEETKRLNVDLNTEVSFSALVALARSRLQWVGLSRRTAAWYRKMYTEKNLQTFFRALRDMSAASRQQGVRFGVFLFPLFTSLEKDYPFREIHERIAVFCEREGIPCLDLLPFYEGRRTSDLWITSFDTHPNETAHRIAAEAVFKWRMEVLQPAAP